MAQLVSYLKLAYITEDNFDCLGCFLLLFILYATPRVEASLALKLHFPLM